MPYKVMLTLPYAFDKFHLMGTTVLSTISPIRFSAETGINRAGAANVTVAKRDMAFDPAVVPSNWYGLTPPAAIQMWVIRVSPNGLTQPIWGGLLQDIQTTSGSNEVTLVADEFVAWYDRVTLSQAFAGNGASNYVRNIVSTLLTIEPGPGCTMPLVGPDTTVFTQVYSPQWYEWQDNKILELIRQLSSLDQPFEWSQVIVPGGSATAPTVPVGLWEAQMWFNTPRYSATTYAQDLYRVIAWGEGTVHNADSVRYSFSSRKTATRVKVKGGRGDRGAQVRRFSYPSEYLGQPRYDTVVSEERHVTQGQVDRRAIELVSGLAMPHLSVSAKLRTWSQEEAAVTDPTPEWEWNSIGLGDVIRVSIRDNGLAYDARLRVITKTATIADQRNEYLDVELTPDFEAYSLTGVKTTSFEVVVGAGGTLGITKFVLAGGGTATVNWGDGTTSTLTSGGPSVGSPVSRTYAAAYTGVVTIESPVGNNVTDFGVQGPWAFDLAKLNQFPNLLWFAAGTGNLVNGTVQSVPGMLQHLDLKGSNFTSGIVSWMPPSIQRYENFGANFANQTAGTVMPTNCTYFASVGGFVFSSASVNNILQGLVNNNLTNGTLSLPAPNGPPTGAGPGLRTTLISRGWTVTTA